MNLMPLDIEEINFNNNNTKPRERYKVESFSLDKEYKLEIKEDLDDDENFMSNFYLKKSKKNLPFIIYVLILSGVIFLATIITLIIVYIKYKIYYTVDNDIYLKPSITDHNYTRITFDNQLEIVLVQVDFDDKAGGAITFDTGYLDPKFDPGFLNVAFLVAFLAYRYNDRNTSRYLSEYMGNLNQASEEFYSSTYFTILNSGFQNYLKNFQNYTLNNIYQDINTFLNSPRLRLLLNINSILNNVNEREKHLIEYLIYNITDKNGKDIWRQGLAQEITKIKDNNTCINTISDITEKLFNPKKTKLLFSSHYKMSLMRKFILKYLKKLTRKEQVNEDDKEENNIYNTLNTNKIIYHEIEKNKTNYIKINYYISDPNRNISELYMDLGYFNYIKYILDETHEDSLYYNLTHPKEEKGLNIKSISCSYEIVLKKYIRFSILINLNEYSYSHLKKIIEMVYNHIEKIKLHIYNILSFDQRAEELFNIIEQNFTFTEDIHEGEYYKNKAKDLFYRDKRDYFLKEVWVPPDFNKNYTKMKLLINQLTLNNSVVIVGISKYIINKKDLDNISNEESFIFKDLKNTTTYSNITYSFHELSKLNLNINNSNNDINTNNTTLMYHKNEYISSYKNEIEKGEIIEDKNYTCINDSDSLVQFYLLKDTNFKLPKVYINFYLFHPFIRPNYTEQNQDSDYLYFHHILYLSYIRREINLQLSDAIRAGNIFKLNKHENYFYLDIFAYSDKVEKILEILKQILTSDKSEIIKNSIELYRDWALEDFVNFDNDDFREKLRLEYVKYLTNNIDKFPPVYNYYKFNRSNFENLTVINNGNNINYLKYINAPIVYAYILGFYEMDDANKIYKAFSKDFTMNYFKSTLDPAKYSLTNIAPKKFVEKILYRENLNKIIVKNDMREITTDRIYSLMIFSKYSYENRILTEMLKIIGTIERTKIESINQNNIYLRLSYPKGQYDNTSVFKKSIINYINASKTNYTNALDIVGDRYYYLIKNMENEYSKTPYTMRQSGLSFSYDQIYNLYNVSSYKLNIDDYDNFTNTIKEIFNKDDYYCEFSNS